MRIDWGTVFTIFLAIILSSFVERKFLTPATSVTQTNVEAIQKDDSIEGYINTRYPNATTV